MPVRQNNITVSVGAISQATYFKRNYSKVVSIFKYLSRMKLSQQLTALINIYQEFLESNHFKMVNETISRMGVLRDYDNQKLRLRFINDRGICEVLITQSENNENLDYFDLDAIRILKIMKDNQPINNRLRRNQRYSTKENFEFISENYELLKVLFNSTHITETKDSINEIQTKRAKIRYGY